MPKEYGTPGPRAIYPELCDSRSLSKCGLVANALWPRLIASADDQGRLAGDAGDILGLCFPKMLGKVALADVEVALEELGRVGQVEAYDVDGEPFVQLVAWWRWQHNQRRAYPSRHPAPAGWTDFVYGFEGHPKTYREAGGYLPRVRNIPLPEPQEPPVGAAPERQDVPPEPHGAVADDSPNGTVRTPPHAHAGAQPRVRGARPDPTRPDPTVPEAPQPPASGGQPSRANGTNPRAVAAAVAGDQAAVDRARAYRRQQRQLAVYRGAISDEDLRSMNGADSPLSEIPDWADHLAELERSAVPTVDRL